MTVLALVEVVQDCHCLYYLGGVAICYHYSGKSTFLVKVSLGYNLSVCDIQLKYELTSREFCCHGRPVVKPFTRHIANPDLIAQRCKSILSVLL